MSAGQLLNYLSFGVIIKNLPFLGPLCTRSGVSFASSFNVYDFQSLASITKTEKHSTSGVRNLETKDKSPQPNKRKVALEARQENFEGLKPFEVKLKMISLNQCVSFYFYIFSLKWKYWPSILGIG